MTFIEFTNRYSTDIDCMYAFRDFRLKQGIVCRTCSQTTHHMWYESCQRFRCLECKTQTTLRSGTILQDSKLPYNIWFMAFYFMSFSKNEISSKEVQRLLGYKRYATVWLLMQKIRTNMSLKEVNYLLDISLEETEMVM